MKSTTSKTAAREVCAAAVKTSATATVKTSTAVTASCERGASCRKYDCQTGSADRSKFSHDCFS
jgi:hypothetical protein